MSDPKRLRETERDPMLFAALDAAALDEAPADAEAKMLAALGLGVAAKVAATVSAPVATNAAAANLAVGATIAKWTVATVVVASAITGGLVYVDGGDRRDRVPAPIRIEPAPTAPAPAPLPPPTITEAPPPPVVEAPSAAPAPRRPVPSASAAPPSASASSSSLAEEVQLLAEANAAVRRRDGAAARTLLDQYDARFPAGSLGTEAEALRIEAVALDDPARGRALAASFLRRHPTSPVAPRLRKLAEENP